MDYEKNLLGKERENLIFKKIKNILNIAYNNSEFYNEKYKSKNFHPDDIKSINDLSLIPPLSKDELKSNIDKIICKNVNKNNLIKSSTGGSTGVPVSVYFDKNTPLEVFGWDLLKSWNLDISDNAGFLERYMPKNDFLNKIMWFPTKRARLDCTFTNKKEMFSFYYKCIKIKPKYLEGYVGAIKEFSSFLIDNKLKLPSVKVVWTTSAPLSKSIRLHINKAFNCPVYDQYGCCEVYWLASECTKSNGLHYYDLYRHLEIVDDNYNLLPNGKEGNLLITDLLNESFPIIRYQNGDVVKKLKRTCDCGSNYPLIDQVKGREGDNLIFKDGSFISSEFMTTIFDDDPELVKEFQIIQKKDYSIMLNYVPQKNVVNFNKRLNKILLPINEKLKNHETIIFSKEVKKIPHNKGKIRYIISEIK